MSIVEFVDYTNDNIKIIDNEDIKHPYESIFDEHEDGENYEIKKIYYGTELLPSTINIGDCIYDPPYDNYTVYTASINNDNKYVLKKGVFESEEELVNEIKLQNKAAEFGLSDPIFLAYILEDGNEYGLIMKKYENPRQIISDFLPIRLAYYAKRKDHFLQSLSAQEEIIRLKSNFIRDVLNKNIIIFKQCFFFFKNL